MKSFIKWVEIPVIDMQRAVDFYNKVFSLELITQDFGCEKMACFPNKEGALVKSYELKVSGNGVLVSLNAGNKLDKALVTIQNEGGHLLKNKTKIESENLDYFAIFSDSEGNTIGIYGK